MHPATRLERAETPRRGALHFPLLHPLGILVLVRHFPAATPLPLRRWLLAARRRDEMKPSISVIAAARRFFASAENASSGKRSRIPLLVLLFLLHHRLVPMLLAGLPSNRSPSLGPPRLSPSLLRAKPGDVDSLLGFNFYGDASSNISGKPRLLALVFDERTCRSILSGKTSLSLSLLSFCLLLPSTLLFPSSSPSPLPLRHFRLGRLCHDQIPPLHPVASRVALSSLARGNHSNVIEDRMLSSSLGARGR